MFLKYFDVKYFYGYCRVNKVEPYLPRDIKDPDILLIKLRPPMHSYLSQL